MARRMNMDFTGVESFSKASEGEHRVKVASVEEKVSQGGNDMLVIAYEVIAGKDKGARVYENYPLIDTALWKLKAALSAMGVKAEGKIKLDLDKLIGKTLYIEIFHEEYNGQMRAKISDYSKTSSEGYDEEVEDDEDEEVELPKKKAPAKKAPVKKKPEPEEDDEEEDEEEDWEEEEEEEAPKSKKAPAKKKPTAKKAPVKKKPEPEEDWDDEDDEDWEEA